MLYFETGKHILSKIILVPQVSEATEDLISVLYQLLEISPKNSDERGRPKVFSLQQVFVVMNRKFL